MTLAPYPPLDYESLAQVRYQIRRFQRFSERAARAVGLEPHQHQLMLALKGLPQGVRPRVRELAERLQIQHHSTVELVNRLDRKSTRLNSSHAIPSRMPSSA